MPVKVKVLVNHVVGKKPLKAGSEIVLPKMTARTLTKMKIVELVEKISAIKPKNNEEISDAIMNAFGGKVNYFDDEEEMKVQIEEFCDHWVSLGFEKANAYLVLNNMPKAKSWDEFKKAATHFFKMRESQ